MRSLLRFIFVIAAVGCSGARGRAPLGADSTAAVNPHPVHLARNTVAPLSPIAELGRALFFDARLSRSGQLSCAGCHSPAYAYGPPDSTPVQLGGPALRDQGARAVPSLRYLDRVPNFSIGPDKPEAEGAQLRALTTPAAGPGTGGGAGSAAAGVENAVPAGKSAASAAASAAAMVPRGGLFWDGRANTLQSQTLAPLFNPVEMANADTAALSRRIRSAYGKRLAELFGERTIADPRRLLDEAMFAVARFELEDPSFHPYGSKYDAYLEGRATLTPAEARGLALFENPAQGNCAACHLSRPGPDGRPPMFTDYQYEALGVPRNPALAANRDPEYFDLGLCGPFRSDLAAQHRFCGMFRTPSLRNVATRRAFFHNGVYHTLAEVLEFYAFRDTHPRRIYPRAANGAVLVYDDLPLAYRGNVDTRDAPFGRRPGDAPALTDAERRDIISFLATLTDGYRP
jgi:cytochrome c peroxidase